MMRRQSIKIIDGYTNKEGLLVSYDVINISSHYEKSFNSWHPDTPIQEIITKIETICKDVCEEYHPLDDISLRVIVMNDLERREHSNGVWAEFYPQGESSGYIVLRIHKTGIEHIEAATTHELLHFILQSRNFQRLAEGDNKITLLQFALEEGMAEYFVAQRIGEAFLSNGRTFIDYPEDFLILQKNRDQDYRAETLRNYILSHKPYAVGYQIIKEVYEQKYKNFLVMIGLDEEQIWLDFVDIHPELKGKV
ncbi:DUF2268 domain-containing putative Zn-dependent protease [Deinococcus aestuarii]|uniref:DUF2268 domain-containing putative Zn-dependent protease n=1 Tax=Deinococcus aestuarii TaxID=2774531 RepID=UPI001C0E6033|nr:DUF2268 domain-containing putative Zn-dependent protease [Deinococcus aestuarii]